MSKVEDKKEIDMNLYSRQIGAYGVELMGKLIKLKVLIVGCKGIGVETAKNLILAGPNTVTVYDNEPVAIQDLGTNFYLTENDIGKKRSEVCIKHLEQLNSYVNVNAHTGELNEKFIDQYHVVVFTVDYPQKDLVRFNDYCHNRVTEMEVVDPKDQTKKKMKVPSPIVFMYASNNGLAGSIFCDFGPDHVVTDKDGEPNVMNVVESISADGVVAVAAKNHNLTDGDLVKFEEVQGMTEVNYDEKQNNTFKVERLYAKSVVKGKNVTKLVPDKFKIVGSDLSKFGKYTNGGIVTTVKPRIHLNFKTFAETLQCPPTDGMFPHMDMNKIIENNQGAQLHIAKCALFAFQAKHGHLPRLHNADDAKETFELASQINEDNKKAGGSAVSVEKVCEPVVHKYALYSTVEISGFTAFLGGVVAQEVVKAPGKYTPIYQWFHHDAFELLEDKVPADAKPLNSRYDNHIACFGKAVQDKIMNQRWFLVGAGALGCEYMKGFALMGVGAGAKGQIYVTDMDRIEVSNLNRQFLFHKQHVGKPKSVTAAAAAKDMNPDLHITTFETFVGDTTENIFDDSFWDSLDGVWNALDNVKARRYTDSKCVFHEKPLLESGTLGTKANNEVIIPHKTQCYSDHPDQELEGIPMCTLRNFPHFIEHCIEWARAQFTTLFENGPQEVNSLLKDREGYFTSVTKEGNAVAQREKLAAAKFYLEKSVNATYQTCVQMAYDEFIAQYRNRINDLTHAFPEKTRKINEVTKEDEGPFWAGEKRFPSSAVFDPKDDLHASYIMNSANLLAFSFGIEPVTNLDQVRGYCAKIQEAAEWKPPAKSNINLKEDAKVEASDDDVEAVDQLKKYFRSLDLSKYKPLKVSDFEKDDDTNFHIDFITACSNLRAWNYRIKQSTRHNCKMIAGKIIPAIATTTAMIAGFCELEYLKLVKGLVIDKHAASNVNLATASFQSFAPLPPKEAKKYYDINELADVIPVPDKFTVWDKTVVDAGDLTVGQFLEAYAKVNNGVKISMLFKYGITEKDIGEGKGQAVINTNPYLPEASKKKQAERAQMNLKKLYEELYGPLACASRNYLILACSATLNDNPVQVPRIKYVFKK